MKSMTCKHVQAVLVDYIEAEIPVDQRKRLNDHLSECYICSQEYNGLRDMISNAKDLSIPDPGDAFWASLPDLILDDVNTQKSILARAQGTLDASVSGNSNNVVRMTPKLRTATQQQTATPPISTSQTATSQTTTLKTEAKQQATVTSLIQRHSWGVKILSLAATLLLAVSVIWLLPREDDIRFNSLTFQHAIHSDQGLAVLVSRFVPLHDDSARFGFNDQSPKANAFVIGALYAETLALLSAGSNDAGVQHLDLLAGELTAMSATEQLLNFVQGVKALIIKNQQTRIPLRQFASFQADFEQFLSDQQAENKTIVLFRMGTWSVDFGLAAAVNDQSLLHQQAELDYFKQAMVQIQAPIGVINTLDNMAAIVNQDSISDRNANNLFQMVQKLRGLLG